MEVQMITCKYCKKPTPVWSNCCCSCGKDPRGEKRKAEGEIKVPKPRRLPSGSWTTRVMVNGQRISVTADTEADCKAKAAAVKAGLIEASRQPKTVTLHEAIDKYIAARDLSPETLRGYRRTQKRYADLMKRNVYTLTAEEIRTALKKERKIYPIPKACRRRNGTWGARVEAGGVTREIFAASAEKYEKAARAFKAEILGAGLSSKTLREDKALIVSSIAAETGVKPEVKIAKGAKREHLFLEPEEIHVFCDAIRGETVEIAALLALCSLRRSELMHLEWSAVDLDNRLVHVAGADVYDEHNKRVSKEENKNESSRRSVPIMMDQLAIALKAAKKTEGRVVTCAPDTVRRRVNAICRANGMPEVGTHGLRHSFASLAAHLGVPENVAQQIGGWQNDKIMREIYTHVYQTDKERYKNEMAQFYNDQPSPHNGNEIGNSEQKK